MGNNPNQRLGRVVAKVDGNNLELREISWKLPGTKRDDLNEGKEFTETDTGGWVKGKKYLKKGISLKQINEMDDGTLILTTDTGQTYMCSHAWSTDTPEMSKDGGEIEFHFAEAEEMTNG